MFTGIVKKTSKVKSIKLSKEGMVLRVTNTLGKIDQGSSISLNGVCSTVIRSGKDIVFDYMPESIKVTNLKYLKVGSVVNLEPSLKLGDTLDGHIVLGHIDTTGKLVKLQKEGNSHILKIKIGKPRFMKHLVYKGAVTLEGISLTVSQVYSDAFEVKIIPFTWNNTNLKLKKVGDVLNIEFDILAKYANRK